MVSMDKLLLYKRAYGRLNGVTPLRIDCGQLCNSLCCKGDYSRGMILFPGEIRLQHKKNHVLDIKEMNGMDFMVCKGICVRKERPLACRIFPLLPYLDSRGSLKIIHDPRARYLCPLLWGNPGLKVSAYFRKEVYGVFRFLLKDGDIKNHVEKLTRIADEYAVFTGSFDL